MYRKMITLLGVVFSIVTFAQKQNGVTFSSNNTDLNNAFEWAKNKALYYAHDDSDPVGFWYEAALPNREAFCMRDVSHQSIGAEILGLSKHNFNMFLKFAQNISEEKDYCSWWEINRYNKPAPVDYENDKDFWYNLPANFDVVYNTGRLYRWTGNLNYLQHPDLQNFYKLSLNEYVDRWELGFDKVLARERDMHLVKPENGKLRFGNKRGIPTYNEGGRGETLLSIDLTASLIAAYKAYADILRLNGKETESEKMAKLAQMEQQFLTDFWWDAKKGEFKSILYVDNSYDYFMVGNNQAFQHYVLYFNALSDKEKISTVVNDYIANYKKLIVELKSYLPIIFYENGHSDRATKMIVELCSQENKRRDYPENSFTIIEHITRGLMGIEGYAEHKMVQTYSRLDKESDWAEIRDISILGTRISVKHNGHSKTTLTNHGNIEILWNVNLKKCGPQVLVNGIKTQVFSAKEGEYSFTTVKVPAGETVVVSTI
ncbi:hypothetical protein OU798_09400 [Prolixibacteraceae bacterium Z1-6]|uniref:Alpha-L-rhamnosidase six-hairpin glycosidase domain-containing protein n=1 Tax=Draconibacterium aestuarii TaxID=2998507 RepID=A0A9X3J6J9_9BACT|nr:hypothetical protein [Prolixibacteraceae bacterium Z1-6]